MHKEKKKKKEEGFALRNGQEKKRNTPIKSCDYPRTKKKGEIQVYV
jgi:hypothetical protein